MQHEPEHLREDEPSLLDTLTAEELMAIPPLPSKQTPSPSTTKKRLREHPSARLPQSKRSFANRRPRVGGRFVSKNDWNAGVYKIEVRSVSGKVIKVTPEKPMTKRHLHEEEEDLSIQQDAVYVPPTSTASPPPTHMILRARVIEHILPLHPSPF